MSWFGWGKKTAKKTPEEEYKVQLNQLEKLGYNDHAKNVALLKVYKGDANLVIKDYLIQQPSSQSVSPPKKNSPPQAQKQKPAPASKTPPKAQQQQQPAPASPPKQEPEQQQKQQAQQQKQSQSVPKKTASPASSNAQKPKPEKSQFSNDSGAEKEKNKKPFVPSNPAKMAQAVLNTDVNVSSSSSSSKQSKTAVNLTKNLTNLPSSDIRQLLLNIDEPVIAEIVLSNSVGGADVYDYAVVNALLQRFNVGFADTTSYNVFLQQLETSYQKHGVVVTNSRLSDKVHETKSPNEEKESNLARTRYDALLKQDLSTLISSDVRELLLPFNREFAERMYAFSLNGADLCRFDYNGALFATQTSAKMLTKECWQKMVISLKLPQTEPFEAAKWEKLARDQEQVIRMAQKMETEIQNLSQEISQNQTQTQKQVAKEVDKKPQSQKKQSQKQQSEQKQKQESTGNQKRNQNKLEIQSTKQLQEIVSMEKQVVKTFPVELQKLQQRQMVALTKLHDIAAIVGMDAEKVSRIETAAKQAAVQECNVFLKKNSGVGVGDASAQSLEQKQLRLLTRINQTRTKLQSLAQQKGVSLDALAAVYSGPKSAPENVCALNAEFDVLFQNLANIASNVCSTAQKYGVVLDNSQDAFLRPMFADLEQRQKTLIKELNFMKEQTVMFT